jgi:hypothetical protein
MRPNASIPSTLASPRLAIAEDKKLDDRDWSIRRVLLQLAAE